MITLGRSRKPAQSFWKGLPGTWRLRHSIILLIVWVLVFATAFWGLDLYRAYQMRLVRGHLDARTWSMSLYFTIITVTTVGFGDVLPLTAPERVVSALDAIFGVVDLSLSAGVIVASMQAGLIGRALRAAVRAGAGRGPDGPNSGGGRSSGGGGPSNGPATGPTQNGPSASDESTPKSEPKANEAGEPGWSFHTEVNNIKYLKDIHRFIDRFFYDDIFLPHELHNVEFHKSNLTIVKDASGNVTLTIVFNSK